jgi:two-component system NtrC family sensor kinase
MATSDPNANSPDPEQINQALLNTQRLASIGTITASVAHELTNPISIITATCNNMAKQLADGTLSPDELGHYIEMIDYSAWRCARLIQTLRNYTHLNDSEQFPCDLNEIIQNALILVAYQFERQYNIDIETDLNIKLPPVLGDASQLTQVVVNLLLNARDAMAGRRGVVRIKTWRLPDRDAQAVAISDTGTGIAPENVARLFEPFFTTKPVGQGTGLGLSIAAEIVGRHGGTIGAANNPDVGATFTVVLPNLPRETRSNDESGRRH